MLCIVSVVVALFMSCPAAESPPVPLADSWVDGDRIQAADASSWSPLGRYGDVASTYWTLHVSHAGEASTLQALIDTWWPGTFQIYSSRETQMLQSAMVGAAMAFMSGFVGPWGGARGAAAAVAAGRRHRRAIRGL